MPHEALPDERRLRILERLESEGKVTVPSLSKTLSVSVDTIRRDLMELERGGQLTRVHGGALPRSPSIPPYAERRAQNIEAKDAIAKGAAQLLKDGQVVLLDSGTTTLQVAKHINPQLRATVVTPSPPIAMALATHEHVRVVMPGGTLDKESMTLTGSATFEALGRIHADVCVTGICSLHAELGISTVTHEEAEIKRVMLHNAREVIAPVTINKLQTSSPFWVAGIDQVSHIVTEASVSEKALRPYHTLGINIIKVSS